VEGQEVSVHREPSVSSYHIQASSPSLSDLQADEERIIETLNHQYKLHCNSIDIDVLRKSSPLLRSWNWEAQVSLRDQEVIAINPWSSHQLGLAIDLGTTKVAGYLLDLSSGKTLASEGMMNPQISYGEDIVFRISYAMESRAKAVKLQQVVVEVLNQLTANLCRKTNTKSEEILEAVIVGNTAMHHLLLHLPIEGLAASPFAPAVRRALDIKARDIGLCIAPGAYVHLLPNIAGAFGSYINVMSAVSIGMLPRLPLDHFQQVGNAAGIGAKLALLSISKRVEAQDIASRVSYIELATSPHFEEIFSQAIYLG